MCICGYFINISVNLNVKSEHAEYDVNYKQRMFDLFSL